MPLWLWQQRDSSTATRNVTHDVTRDVTNNVTHDVTNDITNDVIHILQGWLNVLDGDVYNPELHHLSYTEPVFARIEGTHLSLKRPLEADIPKRTAYNEPIRSVTFVKQVTLNSPAQTKYRKTGIFAFFCYPSLGKYIFARISCN